MSRAKYTMRVLLEVRFMHDGTWEWMIAEPDGRKPRLKHKKWKRSSCGFFEPVPSWEELHNMQYAADIAGHRPLPGFIESIFGHIKFVVHCLSIRDRQHSGLPQPGRATAEVDT